MTQKYNRLKVREVKIRCSVCGRYFKTKIFHDKTYQGGNCFHSLDPSDKTETWECDSCWGTELISI